MDPKDWKKLKDELESRNLSVEVKGRQKKEYIASTSDILIDILRGGIGHSGSKIEVYIFNSSADKMIVHDYYRTSVEVLEVIDMYLADLKEFGMLL